MWTIDKMNKSTLIFCLAAIFAACSTKGEKGEYIPDKPDYFDSSQWYIINRGADVDIFYVISTECEDYSHSGQICHYADTRDDSLRRLMMGEMEGVDHLLAGDLNFYSPFYRQCTMETFASDSLMDVRLPLALDDVRFAFYRYMELYNNGRPFILAGFSQGAMAVVDLLVHMTAEQYSRMVAAYVIGYKVTAEDLWRAYITPARDSADIGVTICYNSVHDNAAAVPLLSEGNCVAINPVNWRTDATPATLVDPQHGDTLTVTLDTVSRLLHVDGYTRNDYMLPLIGCEGNYHCLEISLYSECLRHNMALRASQFPK